MKDEARLQTVIELADLLFSFEQPSDNTINLYFRNHRYIGSRDRRYIADLVWQVLRHYGRLSSLAEGGLTGRAAAASLLRYFDKNLLSLFNGDKYAPAPLSETEKARLNSLPAEMPPSSLECPDWLKGRLDTADIEAMSSPASTDLRVNTLNKLQGIDLAGKTVRNLLCQQERFELSRKSKNIGFYLISYELNG